jgi:hypothetical protein
LEKLLNALVDAPVDALERTRPKQPALNQRTIAFLFGGVLFRNPFLADKRYTGTCPQIPFRSHGINMGVENAFYFSGFAAEAAVIALLLWRRVGHKLPVFFAYCIWAFLSDASAYAVAHLSPARYDVQYYFVVTVADFVLQFCVLVELAWSVLRPIRASLSAKTLIVIAAFILLAGAAIWPFAGLAGLQMHSGTWRIVLQMQQTVSMLRIVFFILLAALSQLLSIGWRDRELQVATGFGFYSLVSLAVAVLNTRQANGLQIVHLYRLVAASFLCSLTYWVFSFAQKETERRKFTPQMNSLLLSLAESAHISRVALTALAETDSGNVSF